MILWFKQRDEKQQLSVCLPVWLIVLWNVHVLRKIQTGFRRSRHTKERLKRTMSTKHSLRTTFHQTQRKCKTQGNQKNLIKPKASCGTIAKPLGKPKKTQTNQFAEQDCTASHVSDLCFSQSCSPSCSANVFFLSFFCFPNGFAMFPHEAFCFIRFFWFSHGSTRSRLADQIPLAGRLAGWLAVWLSGWSDCLDSWLSGLLWLAGWFSQWFCYGSTRSYWFIWVYVVFLCFI